MSNFKFGSPNRNYRKNVTLAIYHIDNLRRSVLLIHGAYDTVALPNQSEDFFWKVKDSNKQVASIVLKNETHDIGFHGEAVLPLEFFNEIVAERCSSVLFSDEPVYVYKDN